MNEKFYKLYKIYLKLTNSKEITENELEQIKKEVGKSVLNNKMKDEDPEDLSIDLDFYFNKKDK